MTTQRMRVGEMRFSVEVEFARTDDQFKAIRKDANAITTAALKHVGETIVLPDAKRNTRHLRVDGASVSQTLTIRARSSTATIGTNARGIKRAAIGYLEFGGKWGGANPNPQRPKTAKAIPIPGVGFRAVAYKGSGGKGTRPEIKKPNLGMVRAVSSNRRKINKGIEGEVIKRFAAAGFEIDR